MAYGNEGLRSKYRCHQRNVFAHQYEDKINKELSDYISSVLGVRQGDPLSPMLFIIFINEFEKFMLEHGIGVIMAGELLSCLLFTDDILLFAESKEMLQDAADKLHLFCREMHLEVGLGNKETEYMIIRHSNKKVPDIDLRFGGSPIGRTSQYCYVGTIISDNGRFDYHVEERIKKGKMAANTVRKWGWRYPEYTQKQLYDIYRSNVEATLTAGQECILGSKFDTNNLDGVHYNFLRYMSGLAFTAKASTSREALDLEYMGMVVPPQVARKIRSLSYYTRLKKQRHSPILRRATDTALSLANENGCWMNALYSII
jgi:hypothetical protein